MNNESGKFEPIKLSDIESVFDSIQRTRRLRESPEMTKAEVRNAIERIVYEAGQEMKEGELMDNYNSWHTFARAKRELQQYVGWYSENPYFSTRHDYEAVMKRLVVVLDLDDDYGMAREHHKSELSYPTREIGA